MMNKFYEWLFSEQERRPIGFIGVFFMSVGTIAITMLLVHFIYFAHGVK